MTNRQKEALDFVTAFIGVNGYAPSYQEIGYALKLSSLSSVYKLIRRLKRDGHLVSKEKWSRNLKITGACPMCGSKQKTQLQVAS